MTKDFIGLFDNALSEELCKQFINHFYAVKDLGLVYTRQQGNDGLKHQKDDTSMSLFENLEIQTGGKLVGEFAEKFWECYEHYLNEYTVLRENARYGILSMKLQKTIPGGGYHIWHFEDGDLSHSSRFLTFMIYLNDVEVGGETEFLYLSKRITPKTGRLLIWPAGFTHTHRGNPPLSGDKYILTGWVEWLS